MIIISVWTLEEARDDTYDFADAVHMAGLAGQRMICDEHPELDTVFVLFDGGRDPTEDEILAARDGVY
jgi:hypothetical protein